MGMSMQDIYDKIYNELSKKLPLEDHRKLLKEFLGVLKRSGKDALEQAIKEKIDEIAGR
jgi:hypothetical protein